MASMVENTNGKEVKIVHSFALLLDVTIIQDGQWTRDWPEEIKLSKWGNDRIIRINPFLLQQK